MSVFKNKGNDRKKTAGKPSSPPSKDTPKDGATGQTASEPSNDRTAKHETKSSKG